MTDVAVKITHISPKNFTSLVSVVTELRMHARLRDHPNINIMSHSLIRADVFIAVSALCIGDLHHNQKFIRSEDVPRILAHTMSGLLHLHECGILHNDIKPANILIQRTEVPDVYNYLLTDFGISKLNDGKKSDTTHAYMSPTYIDTRVPTVTSDFWALGKTLYQMITGTDYKTLGYKHIARRHPHEYYIELGIDVSQPYTESTIVRHFVDIVVDEMRRDVKYTRSLVGTVAYMLNEESYDYSSVSVDGYEAFPPYSGAMDHDIFFCSEVLSDDRDIPDRGMITDYYMLEDPYNILHDINTFRRDDSSSLEWYVSMVITYIRCCEAIGLIHGSLSSVQHLCFIVGIIDYISTNFFVNEVNTYIQMYKPGMELQDYYYDIVSVIQVLEGEFPHHD